MQQAIIWTNDGLVYWRIFDLPGYKFHKAYTHDNLIYLTLLHKKHYSPLIRNKMGACMDVISSGF